jgi:pyruvate/2-oxoglutarate/acetoin dehydrogenase E1 component
MDMIGLVATTYKDTLTEAMTLLGQEPDVVFCGYNTRHGGKGGGTFNGVPEEKLIEMPLAENLMVGAAIGMSLDGKLPVVWFERSDFILLAMDAIVNHLDKLARISDGRHNPACIIRAVVGNSKSPLYTGLTHTQNLANAMREMVDFPVIELRLVRSILPEYQRALERARTGVSTMIIEHKDDYSKTE